MLLRTVCAAVFLMATHAQAQIQNEPTEVITASPPSVFSERAGLWPADELNRETFTNDTSTINDRWNSIPGVQARETGSPTISIRGSAQADRVLKLFDGAPLNMGDGLGASDLLIPTEVMSGVSLIKGPASVFYGPSAMAGAVDHRLRFYDQPTVIGALGDDSGKFGDRRLALVVPIGKSKTQLSVLTERDPQDFIYQSTTTSRSGRNDGNSRDLLRATAATDLNFDGWSFKARTVQARSSGSTSGSLNFPTASTFENTASLLTAELAKPFSENILGSLRITDTRIWGAYDANSASPSMSFTSRTSLFADLNIDLSRTLKLKSFSDVSTNHLTASYTGNSEYNESDADIGQTLEVSLTPEISVQPGYRYHSRHGRIFKALAALYAKENQTWSLKFGEGFRAASLTDRYANFQTFIANPGLQPETSWSAELGHAFESGRRYGGFLEGLATKASVYYINYSNLVDTRTVGSNTQKINSGEARSYGAEANVAYGYKVWMASFGYNYLESKNTTANEPLRLSPKHQAVATLAQLFGPFLIEAKETLWSSFFDRDAAGALTELPAWKTFDLTFRTLAFTDWEFRGGVLNLFDQSRELTFGYPEPQRRFFLEVSRSL